MGRGRRSFSVADDSKELVQNFRDKALCLIAELHELAMAAFDVSPEPLDSIQLLGDKVTVFSAMIPSGGLVDRKHSLFSPPTNKTSPIDRIEYVSSRRHSRKRWNKNILDKIFWILIAILIVASLYVLIVDSH